MKRYSVNSLYKMFTVIAAFLFLVVFRGLNVHAIEPIFEAGTQVNTYKKVDVVKFDYEYKVKINATSDFGVEVKDGDKSLLNEVIFAGQKVKVNVKEVENGFLNMKKNPDSVRIYSYNSNRNSFDAEIATFIDDSGEYVLSNDGLYKIVYAYDGSVIYTDYVYIHVDYFYAGIVVSDKYSSSSVFGSITFSLAVDDSTNLNNTKYYYSFGAVEEGLIFTEFTDKVVEQEAIHSIKKDVSVDVLDEYTSSIKQYFFVKLVKIIDGQEYSKILKSKEMYRVTNKVEGIVHLIDSNGNILNEKQYYKKGDAVNILVSFNVPVSYSNLHYTIGDSFYNTMDDVSESVNEVKLSYIVGENRNFVGDFSIKSKVNPNFVVQVNGDNVYLELVKDEMAEFIVDSVKPSLSVEDSSGAYDNKHIVKLTVSDVGSGVGKVLYYAGVCRIAQGNECKDVYDTSNELIKEANIVREGEYEAIISDHFGKFDEQNLALYVQVIDVAGNIVNVVKNGYLLDNIIVPENQVDKIAVMEDIVDGGQTVGKKLLIKVLDEYKVTNVEFKVGESVRSCSMLVKENGYSMYECISVTYDFIVNGEVVLTDEYNNVENYEVSFKYSSLKNEEKQIGGYNFVVSPDNEYEISTRMYNVMGRDAEIDRVVFDSSILEGLDSIFKFSNIPMDVSTLFKDLVIVAKDEIIMLQNSIQDTIQFPTLVELLEKVKHVEGYNKCAVKGNSCELDVLIKYSYKVNNLEQQRFVLVKFLDNTLKYDFGSKEFETTSKVDVNSKYEQPDYKFVTSLNEQISEEQVTIYKNITFVNKNGKSSVVNMVDTSKLGTYYINEYFAYGKQYSYNLEYEVKVVDEIKPTIRLNVDDEIKIYLGEEFDEKGIISVADNYDKAVVIKSSWDKELDVNTPGTYVVSYWAEDSSGNKSDVVKVTVVVAEKHGLITYLIAGGIGLFTILVISLAVLIEIKKERRKIISTKGAKEEM